MAGSKVLTVVWVPDVNEREPLDEPWACNIESSVESLIEKLNEGWSTSINRKYITVLGVVKCGSISWFQDSIDHVFHSLDLNSFFVCEIFSIGSISWDHTKTHIKASE